MYACQSGERCYVRKIQSLVVQHTIHFKMVKTHSALRKCFRMYGRLSSGLKFAAEQHTKRKFMREVKAEKDRELDL